MRVLLAIAVAACLCSCTSRDTLFAKVDSSRSGINFNNEVIESDSLNILQYEYMYNGGGVGVGDFNNDGLPDIYFTGNRVSNKLYINRGNMRFEDVTVASKTTGEGRWSKGVTIVDINNDGRQDIYVSAAVLRPAELRRNLLYINQGTDPATQTPKFAEAAEEYGLADTSSTQMAAFFDYDNDGDLDVYLLVNELDESYPNAFRRIRNDGSSKNNDRLLQNNFDERLKHAVFSDVSKETGITWEGHGLGLNIVDINNDGWKDIYVGNDYISNNILYINDHGKFTNRCSEYFKHSSRNAMGNDIVDLNNDGLQDLVELDMMPEDNYRQKLMNNPIDYQTFKNSDLFGYMHQYARNTLQLNQGPRMMENDSIGEPIFSEIAFYSGVAQTDWSWSVLGVDADNDSNRDLLISNGLPKDLTDLDFMAYRKSARPNTTLKELLNEIPTAAVSNYIYRNNADLSFEDKTKEWGWDFNSTAAGMAYADFDLDGDVDVVINNTNSEATLLENSLTKRKDSAHNYLRVALKGEGSNIDAIGAVIRIYYQEEQQVYEYSPYRGYLSSVEPIAHFGVGVAKVIDSIHIRWPNGQSQVERNVQANQVLIIRMAGTAMSHYNPEQPVNSSNWLTDITRAAGIQFLHQQNDQIDFNYQRLLPYKLSGGGPAVAAGDLNNDGLDDLVIGGGAGYATNLLFQTPNGFLKKELIDSSREKLSQDMGICVFDADGDNDLDMFIAAGGNPAGITTGIADHFYLNNGKGEFNPMPLAVPRNGTMKSCVKAMDYDKDGDLDLFVGGRHLPGKYPSPVSSYIYRNDSKADGIRFTDVTNVVAPGLTNIGMITDAICSDADNDGFVDLILTGEWMDVTFLKNQRGKLALIKTEMNGRPGWWNSVTGADIDNDGDIDYVLGNFGRNSYLQATISNPLRVFAKDFDNNSSIDPIISTWNASEPHGVKKEYPLASRDMLVEQISRMRKKYPTYNDYGNADMDDVLIPEDRKNALSLSANTFVTGWLENKGGFHFDWHTLPVQAQLSSIFGIVAEDFNDDGNIDLLLNGNNFDMSPSLGRNDALNGLLLQGDGQGQFLPLSILQSGLFIPGDGKAAVRLTHNSGSCFAVSQNNGSLKLFRNKRISRSVAVQPDDMFAIIENKNGTRRKEEFYYGSSYLSQSSRSLTVPASAKTITITNVRGVKRTIR